MVVFGLVLLFFFYVSYFYPISKIIKGYCIREYTRNELELISSSNYRILIRSRVIRQIFHLA